MRFAMKRIIRIITMVVTLAFAYGFDRWLAAARQSRPQGPRLLPQLWINSAVTLVMAGILLALAWYILVRSERDKITSWIFLVIGFLMAFLNPLQFTFGSVLLPRSLRDIMAGALVVQAGAFFAVIGIAGLLRRK